MTNQDLVDLLADRKDLTKADTKRYMKAAVRVMSDYLAEGRSFTVPELGTFSVHKRDAHKAYNPHYKQYMMLPPKRVVDFSASESLNRDLKDVEPDNE